MDASELTENRTESARLGAIAVQGDDAADFLRAQLTNDVLRLGADRHALAAWCDAKGRTLMVATVCEYEDGYLVVLPRDLIAPLLRKLQLYVLRANVRLVDVSMSLDIVGVRGDGLPGPDVREQRGSNIVLGLPAAESGPARAVWIGPERAADGLEVLSTGGMDWALQEIDTGRPTILPATSALFVPQMLNLHWLMGIDFDKGCYPGQEVIARLHYRGRLTRRLYRLAWEGEQPAPGASVMNHDGQTQGTIVRSSLSDTRAGRALAVLKIAGADQALSCDSCALRLLDLPYPTPVD